MFQKTAFLFLIEDYFQQTRSSSRDWCPLRLNITFPILNLYSFPCREKCNKLILLKCCILVYFKMHLKHILEYLYWKLYSLKVIVVGLFIGTCIISNWNRSRGCSMFARSFPTLCFFFHTQSHNDAQNPKKWIK